jgi:ELWxxDGT repeat protein
MPGDNQLSGARVVGLTSRLNGKVGRKDLEDLIQFSASGRSSLNLNLSRISKKARAGVELYKLTRPLNEVRDSVGSIDFSQMTTEERSNFQLISRSRARSNRAANINLATIEGGDYMVRIVPVGKRDSRYRLAIAGTLLPEDPIPTPTPDPTPIPDPTPTPTPGTGNSLQDAIPVNLPLSQSGAVSDGDTQDFYSFSLQSAGDYKVDLFGLGADANVEILDSNGAVIKAANTIGVQDEAMIVPLDAGSYYARVAQGGAGSSTNYTLGMRLLTDAYAGTYAQGTPSATDIPLSPAPQTFSNYALDGAKISSEDLITFNVTQRSFFKLELKGMLGDNLDGNLDVQLFSEADFATPENGLISARSGKNAELFGGTLSAGRYYVRILPGGGAGSGEGSEYRLTMSLKPKSEFATPTRDIRFGNQGSSAAFLTESNGLAYFSAVDETDTALWVSDGTLDGTRKLKSFENGSLSSFTEVVTSQGTFLYFMGGQTDTGTELWRTNGTAAGTLLVSDIRPGATGSNPLNLTAAGDRLFFTAIPTATVQDIRFFRTNATGTGVEEVTGVKNISDLAASGNTLYFTGEAAAGGDVEMWRINDVTAASVTPVPTDLNPSGDSTPSGYFVANGKLYAAADNGADPFGSSISLLKIDPSGSPTSTVIQTGLRNPKDFVTIGTNVYFSGFTAANGTELWKLDTTTDTATLLNVADDASVATSSNPTNLVAVGNDVYFFADDGTGSGQSLWKTNGSAPTRVNIADGSAVGTSPTELVAIGNMLYFAATDATKGRELWSFNTSTSTMKLQDINANGDSNPARLTNINGTLFLIADNGQDGLEVMSL